MKLAEEFSYYKNKNILVTGGAGFIGTNLLLKLLDTGANIRATFHNNPPQIKNKKIEFIRANLTSKSDCKKVVKDIDFVFMCAAVTSGASVIEKTPLIHVTPNVVMNTLMLEAAHLARVKKFLFISSNTVYPLTYFPVKEKDVTYELYEKYYPVAWMKIFSEKMCEMYSTKIKNPMVTIIVRPGNVFGPYDDFEWETSHVLPALIRKAVEKHNPFEVWGDGNDIKDFIYVEDLTRGLLIALKKVENFDIFNLGGGKPISIKMALKEILKFANFSKAKIVYNAKMPSMIPIRLIDNFKATKLLNFTPTTSFSKGIQKTVDWYKKVKC